MSRDYKNAKRGGAQQGGTVNFVIGLALGLAIAAGVHVYDKQTFERQNHNADTDTHHKNDKPAPASQQVEPQQQLDFYEQLPKFEVVVPDKGKGGTRGDSAVIDKPGAYILQAGSYRTFAEADRVKALLALQGVVARIEKAPIDTETWHRVRIGPIRDLRQLEETRRKIREAQIDAIVIRVPN